MPDTITPNPPSPFADADPNYRHVLPTFILLTEDPTPGALVVAGCGGMAVVPDEPLRETSAGASGLPDGLCPECIAAMRGQNPTGPARPVTDCRTCDGRTEHDGVCALCRQDMHEVWVAAGRPDGVTIDQTVQDVRAADTKLDQVKQDVLADTAKPAPGGDR